MALESRDTNQSEMNMSDTAQHGEITVQTNRCPEGIWGWDGQETTPRGSPCHTSVYPSDLRGDLAKFAIDSRDGEILSLVVRELLDEFHDLVLDLPAGGVTPKDEVVCKRVLNDLLDLFTVFR